LHKVVLAIPGARVLGADCPLPGTTMVSFEGAPGQLVAIGLDLDGICISTGAACTSGSLEPSPVLRALGMSPARAAEGLRISFGWTTTGLEIERLGALLPEIVERVRAAVCLPTGDGNAAADIALGGAS
jgi:cysteine desulfurase